MKTALLKWREAATAARIGDQSWMDDGAATGAAAARIKLPNKESSIHFPTTPKAVNDRAVVMLTAGSRSEPRRRQA